MDEGPREVQVRIERREGRRAERVAWIGVIAIFIAMAKPWGSAGTPPTPQRLPRATPVTAHEPRVIDPDLPCVGGRWSVEADERWVGTVVRTWVLTDAVVAFGPTDSRIKFVTVAAQQVIALGFCPPFHDAAANATVTFFRLDPAPSIVQTVPVQMNAESEAMANVLHRAYPATEASPAAGSPAVVRETWPAGRYVIRIDAPNDYRRWLGVDVRLIVLPEPPDVAD